MKTAKPPVVVQERTAGRRLRRGCGAILAAGFSAAVVSAQAPLTWRQVRDKFAADNPALKAAQLNIDESRAAEVTAYLRPNPSVTGLIDQLNPLTTMPSPLSGNSVYRPFANTLPSGSVSYLYERQHKRELRLVAARKSTDVAGSTYLDQERSLIFSLRNAFVQTLQAKAILENSKENLEYWDRELAINRNRFQAGDLAQVDLDRLELQRVQFESDLESSIVNLRTSKIQLLTLLNDRTPIEQFEITGPFDFTDRLALLEDFRNIALETRPDLKAASQSVELAKANYRLAVANGSSDPTFGLDFARNPPIPAYFGVSVSIPLRIHDRNQGEKARTLIDIGRNERLLDAARAQVFSDVDSAYVTLVSLLNRLRPYRDKYLKLAEDSRNRISFSYENGGASLLDYLDAEKAYRDTRLAYLTLVGSYLTAAAQMNLAVGREVIQ